MNLRAQIITYIALLGMVYTMFFVSPVWAASTIHVSAAVDDVQIKNEDDDRRWGFGENAPFGDFFMKFFGRRLETFMSGSQEVPGPGDPDGTGEAKVRLKPNQGELCVDIEVENIEPATASHIHHAPAGTAGAVVVVLPIPNAEGEADDCVSVDDQLLEKIRSNPQDYYINIHNNPFPNGAIRGQLSR